ncbi:MAG: hypothetical protein ABIK68_02070, partial [bacterium]
MDISRRKTRSIGKLFPPTLILVLLLSACSPAWVSQPKPLSTASAFPALPTVTLYTPPPGYVEYVAQSGDSLPVVAIHFGVKPDQILSNEPISQQGLINPGQKLFLPPFSGSTTAGEIIIPDSEVVFSPLATDFDINKFVDSFDGKLKKYTDTLTY